MPAHNASKETHITELNNDMPYITQFYQQLEKGNFPGAELQSEKERASIEGVLSELKRLSERIDDAKKKVDIEIMCLSDEFQPEAKRAFLNEFINEMYGLLMATEHSLYKICDSTRISSDELWRQYVQQSSRTEENVQIDITPDNILIRLPYLPKRGKGYGSSANASLAALLYGRKDLPRWSRWELHVHHVFPSATQNIPKDVDNYDYKQTIDLIGRALRASDNALCFAMGMKTHFTDKVPPGSYLQICEKSFANPDFEEWKNRLF